MKAQILKAQPAVESLQKDIVQRVQKVRSRLGRPPHLAVVLVGDDPASVIYTSKKGETALKLGMTHETLRFAATVSPQEVHSAVEKLNASETVDGILIQRPLPASFKEREVLSWVHPSKDVDAFHPETAGKLFLGLPGFAPCTPAGVMALLKHYQVPVSGRLACIVGRSSIVGKPMQALLLAADATVIQVHSKTPSPEALTSQADILVVAAGKPRLIGPKHIKPGAVVVDVGIHRDPATGKVSGDVDFDAVAPLCSAITPVPGGVGPMTIALLMQNTVKAAEDRLG